LDAEQENAMSSTIARRAIPLTVLALALIAVAWGIAGAVIQPRMLADLREDYEDARFAREHPFLVSLTQDDAEIRASEVFARDYEALEDAGYFMAPIRAATVSFSHDDYQFVVDPTERQQFEKERAEREKEEAEEDAERLRKIKREEEEKQDD
jgi:hypothetical protein